MKVIMPHFKNLEMIPLFSNDEFDCFIKFIEAKGRICYHSEDKITKSSAMGFVTGMFKSGHHSQIEHSNLVMSIDYALRMPFEEKRNLKSKVSTKFLNIFTRFDRMFIGGNIRAWVDATGFDKSAPLDTLIDHIQDTIGSNYQPVTDYNKMPPELYRMGVQIIHDRAFTHEVVRHRVMSFSQESQRYCNYGKDKFGNTVTFIQPKELTGNDEAFAIWAKSCADSEAAYLALLDAGISAQIARGVLPNSCKTEIYISGDEAGWNHLEFLRCAPGAHPDMRNMMTSIKQSRSELLSYM